MLRETLLDIVKHTGGLGFIDNVKVTGSEESTLVEAMDGERTVIVKATLLSPEPELIGEFGMGHLPLLQGLVNYPNFKSSDASISIKRKNNEKKSPEEIIFKDSQGQTASYRLMAPELVPDQAKFLGTTWDVEVSPSRSKVQEFGQMAGLYSSIEKYFLVRTENNQLIFFIGDENSSTHKAKMIFGEVQGNLNSKIDLHWPIAEVLNILKLGLDEDLKIQFTGRGACQITMTSQYVEYRYILPARKI